MKRFAIIIGAIAAISGGSVSESAEFKYESFRRTSTGAAEIVLKFQNTSTKKIAFIAADCGLLGKDGKALSMISVIAQNIDPGGYAYAKNYGPQDGNVQKADCRIRDVDYE